MRRMRRAGPLAPGLLTMLTGLLIVLLFLLPLGSAHAQGSVPFYEFGSVGVDYPANPSGGIGYSLQGTLGQTQVVTDPLSTSGQNTMALGLWETGLKWLYTGTVTLQNLSPIANPRDYPLEVRLINTTSDLVDTLSGVVPLSVNPDGSINFVVASWLNPTYAGIVSVKASHWLRQRQVPMLPANPFTDYPFAQYSLLNGDVNGDNAITTADYLLLKVSFGSHPGDPNWNNGIADLTGDGVVSTADYLVLKANFGRFGDP